MWLGIRSLVDMFIEFLVNRVSGETLDEKFFKTLKMMVSVVTILIWLLISAVVTTINAKYELAEYKKTNEAVAELLYPKESILTNYAETNNELNRQIGDMREENVTLVKDNIKLAEFSKRLLHDLRELREKCEDNK